MTRPPLELLELLICANAAAQNPGEEYEDLAEQFVQVMADPATGEQLRALRAQAEAEAGLRAAVTQLMSDPWSYHYEEKGAVKRCVGCGEKEGTAHEHWCPVPSITAALAQADAGGEQ